MSKNTGILAIYIHTSEKILLLLFVNPALRFYSTLEKHVKKKHGDAARSMTAKVTVAGATRTLRTASDASRPKLQTGQHINAMAALMDQPVQLRVNPGDRASSVLKSSLVPPVATFGASGGLFGIANTNYSSNVAQQRPPEPLLKRKSVSSDCNKASQG